VTRDGGSALLSRFTLSLPAGGACPIVVGSGASAEAPDHLRASRATRCAIITDSNLERSLGAPVLGRFREAGVDAAIFAFPAGERHKTRAVKETIEDRLLAAGFGRDAAIVAVGGGVTLDLAGFVAATYMRGIPLLQVPTSLLAMADAAIGGKNGVDHPLGKNLIGTLHHPAAILADTDFLDSLPDREHRTGLAEIIKAGIIRDAVLFGEMEARADALATRDRATVRVFLERGMRLKAEIVAADDAERDLRKILNFGHTIGHALELVTDFTMSHGEAISVGMVAEAGIAVRLGLIGAAEASRMEALLRAVGLPARLPEGVDPRRLVDATVTDKKSRGGQLEFALPAGIGVMARTDAGYARAAPRDLVLGALDAIR